MVTTNDYLARRDGESMGQVLRYLGLTVGIVQGSQREQQRKLAYNCDVTYVANQELGFDFLRDNLAMSTENIVQTRSFNYCIVDEADSILIDEARTPLIISRKGSSSKSKVVSAAQIAANLIPNKHYEVDFKTQRVDLTVEGFRFAEQIVGKGLFDLADPWAYYILNALRAKELCVRDREYIIQQEAAAAVGEESNGAGGSISGGGGDSSNGGVGSSGDVSNIDSGNGNINPPPSPPPPPSPSPPLTKRRVALVDAATGRVLAGRRFTDGLQQAIEAKEKLPVSSETQVVAKVTYQNLFRLFNKLAGMTGTANSDASELFEIYGLKVFPVPTALPVARRDNPDAVFRTQTGKLKALLRNVLKNHQQGRPVLIGTTSVEDSEEMVAALDDIGELRSG